VPEAGEIDYSSVVKLDLGSVTPSLAGPKRPQDRVELGQMARNFTESVDQVHRRERFQPARCVTDAALSGGRIGVNAA
jgi:aconitate hydratase